MTTGNHQLDNFERAFRESVSSCRGLCDCGVIYYNPDFGADWEKGELDYLEKNAVSLPHSVGFVTFNGKTFVDGCSCWHEIAKRTIAGIINHRYQVAEFLTLEKKRLTAEAEAFPTVAGQ